MNKRQLYGIVWARRPDGSALFSEPTFRKDVAEKWASEFGQGSVLVYEDEAAILGPLTGEHFGTGGKHHPSFTIVDFDAGLGWDLRYEELAKRARNPSYKPPRPPWRKAGTP